MGATPSVGKNRMARRRAVPKIPGLLQGEFDSHPELQYLARHPPVLYPTTARLANRQPIQANWRGPVRNRLTHHLGSQRPRRFWGVGKSGKKKSGLVQRERLAGRSSLTVSQATYCQPRDLHSPCTDMDAPLLDCAGLRELPATPFGTCVAEEKAQHVAPGGTKGQ